MSSASSASSARRETRDRGGSVLSEVHPRALVRVGASSYRAASSRGDARVCISPEVGRTSSPRATLRKQNVACQFQRWIIIRWVRVGKVRPGRPATRATSALVSPDPATCICCVVVIPRDTCLRRVAKARYRAAVAGERHGNLDLRIFVLLVYVLRWVIGDHRCHRYYCHLVRKTPRARACDSAPSSAVTSTITKGRRARDQLVALVFTLTRP